EKFLPPVMDEVTSSDEEVVEETSKRSKHDHASSKSPIQISETTIEEVHEIQDDFEDSRQYDDSQQKTSSASASSRKGASHQESQ
ncbi:11309_t:CDS:2, partial [Gigaspora margarita]